MNYFVTMVPDGTMLGARLQAVSFPYFRIQFVWKHYSISHSLCFKGNCKRMESEGCLRQVEGNFIAVLWILYLLRPWSPFLLQHRQRTRNSCRRLNRQETEQEINCFVLYKPRISTYITLCIIMGNWNSHCLALQLIHVERKSCTPIWSETEFLNASFLILHLVLILTLFHGDTSVLYTNLKTAQKCCTSNFCSVSSHLFE